MNYYQGYDDGYWEGRNSVGRNHFAGWLVSSIIGALFQLVIFSPLLMLGYWLADHLHSAYSNDWTIKVALVIFFSYILYAILYFLKGMIIRLRDLKRKWWVVVWFCCVALTCGLQILIVQYQLEGYFHARRIANYSLWSLAGSLAVGAFVYLHYSFLTNIAPRSVFWAYKTGAGLIGIIYRGQSSPLALRSRTFFGNTRMKVSFRKK